VFRIDASIDESRSEPLLVSEPRSAMRLRLSPRPAPLANETGAAGRREPSIARDPLAAFASPTPPERGRPVASEVRRRPFGPLGSLILHLLPLLLLLHWPMHPPAVVTPIPVRLVFQPPPPLPKPAAKPRPKAEMRPPRGRIASETMGDTHAKGHDREKSRSAAAKPSPATAEESPFEAPQQTAFLPPPPLLPTPPKITLPRPSPRKPAEAMRRLIRRAPGWARLDARPARLPGPAATRDEYLAYLAYLAHQHLGLLSRSLIGERRGETIINVLVLDNGTVAMLSVGQSSGYPDIDARVEDMIRAVGRFPPLPQWFQGARMQLEFRLEFPEALD
jgi:TonB family protein